MPRATVKLSVLALIAIVAWFVGRPTDPPPQDPSLRAPRAAEESNVRQAWGRPETLADHFARHGKDFGARDAEDYASQAAALFQRARTQGLPAKQDADGSLRIYEPSTGAFGAYNRNGTARTFFKPGSAGYFERQPGTRIDLRNGR